MEATPTPIIKYFSGFQQYLVPLFQRPYMWEKRQWQALWDDILVFYGTPDQDKATHFMGAIVTMPARSVPVGVSKYMLIDGQQRLTTIAILLCAVRDALAPSEELPRKQIQDYYLTNFGSQDWERFKLLPTQSDRAGYTPVVLQSPQFPDSRFRDAYAFFRRSLKAVDEEGNQLDPKQILAIVESRLMAVMINLSDSDDPYLIFESLNYKGTPLQQADLVRNYFLMRFPVNEQTAIYESLWLPMQEGLGAELTEFMRHFLGAGGEEVRRGDVYAAIKRLVSNSDSAAVRDLVTRMRKLAVFYGRIAGLTKDEDTKLDVYFQRFRKLDFSTAYPLLLRLYEDCAEGLIDSVEFRSCLGCLESYIVRRMVSRVPSNSLSGVFIGLCREKPATDAPSIWLAESLAMEGKNRRWSGDQEFRESWIHSAIYGNRACPIILQRIEEQFGHHEPAGFGSASIEHVLPQTLSEEWRRELGEGAVQIQAEWQDTIGNLTLTGYNPELSNRPFREKQKLLAESHFELNRYFANCGHWGSDEIQKRAASLFEIALRLWPRPELTEEAEAQNDDAGPSANFHADCVRAAQSTLQIELLKVSRTKYESDDHATRVICAVSAQHAEQGENPYFWFALHHHQIEFLNQASAAWLCYGCGSSEHTLLIPASIMEVRLSELSATTSADRSYWHVVVRRKGGRYLLRVLGGHDGLDLTPYLIRAAKAAPEA